ncbi:MULTISPECIES: amino acid permease [Corynebacterium]|uniref:amino acid permease n=1 Tax=Corynebacterium TaxID=1716 RepID=UPI0008A88CAA|nr:MULTISPECIES: amino acid permease [Corynebacterium]MDK8663169.1 amino acid permease [Corynebacterium coyleae]MDK8706485.1 amino acid permease [Corynebacterium coyleae]MDK8733124.1 amino acid permease [Corynebacterium coyleae]MDK8892527.1 amino acid permease [Corynebacterium coyleae]OHO30689.1 amino acid transporter [Corynebacterium sp. HMSC034B08]
MGSSTSNSELGTGLKSRHLTLMGLGTAVGAGLFLGVGVGIRAAGPAILVAYAIAGLIVIAVMRMLGEMAAAHPSSGSFATYGRMAYGHWAGFLLGWLYYFLLIMACGAELTGASAMMASWFDVPQWVPGLIVVVVLTAVNLAQVKGFGEFEYWFAMIKIAVIVGFLIIGVLLWLGVLPASGFVGFDNVRESGFAPNGVAGIAAGLLAVAFAFGGIEVVTIAAAESEDPADNVKRAVNSIIWRIAIFYLGSVAVITLLLPYATIDGADSAADSPFTAVLEMANIPGAAAFMEVVIVLALLSAFNAQLYGTSRLGYQQALEGDAPKWMAKTNANNVPMNSVLVSVVFAFLAVGLQWWNPPGMIDFIMSATGGCLIVTWIMITLSFIKLHPRIRESAVRVHGATWVPWVTLVALVGLTVLMLFDDAARSQVISVTILSLALVGLSLLTKKRGVVR